MSDFDPTSQPPPSPAPRSGCATLFMVIIGFILMLPGLCALIIVTGTPLGHIDASGAALILFAVLLGVAGIFLIRAAVKGP